MREYLKRNEVEQMKFLQKHLLTHEPANYNTNWEIFRLLAIMEVVNNGSRFGQLLLGDAVSPYQAGKLSLTPIMEKLREAIGAGWDELVWLLPPAKNTKKLLFSSAKNTEKLPSELCWKVNKLTKV